MLKNLKIRRRRRRAEARFELVLAMMSHLSSLGHDPDQLLESNSDNDRGPSFKGGNAKFSEHQEERPNRDKTSHFLQELLPELSLSEVSLLGPLAEKGIITVPNQDGTFEAVHVEDLDLLEPEPGSESEFETGSESQARYEDEAMDEEDLLEYCLENLDVIKQRYVRVLQRDYSARAKKARFLVCVCWAVRGIWVRIVKPMPKREKGSVGGGISWG